MEAIVIVVIGAILCIFLHKFLDSKHEKCKKCGSSIVSADLLSVHSECDCTRKEDKDREKKGLPTKREQSLWW